MTWMPAASCPVTNSAVEERDEGVPRAGPAACTAEARPPDRRPSAKPDRWRPRRATAAPALYRGFSASPVDLQRDLRFHAGGMRAVWMKEYGGPEVLEPGEAPDPVAGPGQALVEVAFANITFVETQFRARGFGPVRAQLPMIPGNGVGGVVVAVGDGRRPGADRPAGGRRRPAGPVGTPSLVAADADGFVEVPAGVALDEAVALLADGRTATMLVASAALVPGERVLVEAAAGGVGSLLVQLATAAGARVVAAAGGPRKLALARVAGRRGRGRLRRAGLGRGRAVRGGRARRGVRRGGRRRGAGGVRAARTAAAGWSASGWPAATGRT